jgi:hypothetical protein
MQRLIRHLTCELNKALGIWLWVPCRHKAAGGISEMKSKQQSPCSKCMHWPVMSWGNACSRSGVPLVSCLTGLESAV